MSNESKCRTSDSLDSLISTVVHLSITARQNSDLVDTDVTHIQREIIDAQIRKTADPNMTRNDDLCVFLEDTYYIVSKNPGHIPCSIF